MARPEDAPTGAFVIINVYQAVPDKKGRFDKIARRHSPANLAIDPSTCPYLGEGMDIQALIGLEPPDGNRHLPRRTINEKRGT